MHNGAQRNSSRWKNLNSTLLYLLPGTLQEGICPQNTLLSYAHAHTHEGAQRHNAGWGNPSNPVRTTQAPALVSSRCPWGESTTVLNTMSEQEPQTTLWTLWKHILTWMNVYIELNNKNKWYWGTFPTRLLQNLQILTHLWRRIWGFRKAHATNRTGGWKEESIRKSFLRTRNYAQGNQIASLWLLSILHFTPTILPLPLFATEHEVPELRSTLNDGSNENSSLTLKGRNWARAEKIASSMDIQ